MIDLKFYYFIILPFGPLATTSTAYCILKRLTIHLFLYLITWNITYFLPISSSQSGKERGIGVHHRCRLFLSLQKVILNSIAIDIWLWDSQLDLLSSGANNLQKCSDGSCGGCIVKPKTMFPRMTFPVWLWVKVGQKIKLHMILKVKIKQQSVSADLYLDIRHIQVGSSHLVLPLPYSDFSFFFLLLVLLTGELRPTTRYLGADPQNQQLHRHNSFPWLSPRSPTVLSSL